MKIAFTGPSGAGKTTLAKKLSETYKIKLVTSVASERAYMSPEMQTLHVTARFMDLLASGEPFVSDRWFFDNLIYAKIQGFPRIYLKMLEYLIDFAFSQGVKVFYVPHPLGSTQNDVFNNLLLAELKSYNSKVVRLEGTGVDERLEFVKNYLKKKEKKKN